MFTFGSLIFSMFKFFVRCDLCVLIVGARRVCLFREMGKWEIRGMGDGLLNGLMGGTGV